MEQEDKKGKAGVSIEDHRWLLREMWLGCDGRWFLNVADRYGFEVANEINRIVNSSLARACMRRLQNLLRFESPSDIADLKRIIEIGYEVYHPPPACEIELKIVNDQALVAVFHKCPVMEKVNRGGGMRNYVCGCPWAFEGWMEVLGVKGKSRIEKGPEAGPPCQVSIKVGCWPDPNG